jgi:DNA mismatch endonuclease (patch repair protein)
MGKGTGKKERKDAAWPGVPEATRRIMRSIRSTDTKPEKALRSLCHSLGYRFRVHAGDLPGKPDVAFTARRKAVWLHGCFWHQHPGCNWTSVPRTRPEYWEPKLAGNQARDAVNVAQLLKMGWTSLVIWECEMRSLEEVAEKLRMFLGPPRTTPTRSARWLSPS